MAKISLRAYNHEIETLIDRGQAEEGIAHCKYILKVYPKHLDTYRLLGKAFLESQRFSEAADILQRILSVQPDDFVSQIGMSIIREDEGNLDAAIYHMERAFEIQPSNAAIQDELRRLYGRRDGMEPPKLRLTRGALVRMYARGDLYRQAIAEARAALKEDPQRLDLEIVLARMYYLIGQKAEAAEISSRLVGKLPFCYEANRILAEVLPETSRADDAKTYRQKLFALDPYLAHLTEQLIDPQQVQENAVSLDRLEWIPTLEGSQQPSWASSLGIKLDETETEKVPDWLAVVPSSDSTNNEISTEANAQPFSEEPALYENHFDNNAPTTSEHLEDNAEADLPDWMKSSGWSVSDQPDEQIPETPAIIEEEGAAPADLPEWLKNMAPASEGSTQSVEADQSLDWMNEVLPGENKVETKPVDSPPSTSLDAIPPAGTARKETSPINDELPDWFKSPVQLSDDPPFADQSNEPLPDWLTDTPEMKSENPSELTAALPSEAIINPVDSLTNQPFSETVLSSEDSSIESADHSTLSEPAVAPQSTIPTPGVEPEFNHVDGALAWLESLAARQGAEEETLLTPANERSETPPEWVSQAVASDANESRPIDTHNQNQSDDLNLLPGAALPQEKVEEDLSGAVDPTANVNEEQSMAQINDFFKTTSLEPEQEIISSSLPAVPHEIAEEEIELSQISGETHSAQQEKDLPVNDQSADSMAASLATGSENVAQGDMDAAFAWLESLAAKQGAEEGSLLVTPEDRQENPPDWVQSQVAETKNAEEIPAGDLDEAPAIPEWIQSTTETPQLAELEPTIDQPIPNWLKEMEASPDGIAQTSEETLPAVLDQNISEPSWFQEQVPPIESISTTLPQETESAEQNPDNSPLVEKTASFGKTRPLPTWLSESSQTDEDKPADEQVGPAEELPVPDWLKEAPSPVSAQLEDTALSNNQAPDLPDWLKNLEAEQEDPLTTSPLPVEQTPVPLPGIEVSTVPSEMLGQAQEALSKGQIERAMTIFGQLIQQDQHLDETIHDLRDALYRYPVESEIWQTLGDAYIRSNRVQDALDAYTKAEELLR